MADNKKTIKIKYVDVWDDSVPNLMAFTPILEKHYNVIYSDEPDYIFCSCFDNEHRNYDCIKIFFSGENILTDFNTYDYGMDCASFEYLDRHLHSFLFMMITTQRFANDMMLIKHEAADYALKSKDAFCSFVYRNQVPMRQKIFDALSTYKTVNSGGLFLNNTQIGPEVKDKIEFESKHKFSIAFENISCRDYITEKLVHSFAAGTVPIYWGAPNITEYFNPDAMIIIKEESDIPAAVERIIELDNDDEQYLAMLRQPALQPRMESIFNNYESELEKFIRNIFDQPIEEAQRRNRRYSNYVQTDEKDRLSSEPKGIIARVKRRF